MYYSRWTIVILGYCLAYSSPNYLLVSIVLFLASLCLHMFAFMLNLVSV